ncbi:MAG: tetratricopeptide repeat protein [Myxococcota bacterium]
MALNKRKVLDSARKLAQKGAKAKALKEYQLLLQADPRDAKLLLEVGDCYRRWGQVEDAIAQYAKVAQQYRQDGFDARAVAVYKQILNLDPKHYAAYVSLSELYQRMGLDAEAIGALQTAADGYHREGRKTDALELLRQMAALDPTNVTSRLKVAELLRQEKMTAEALAEYEAAARELESQQDRDQLITVRERILELKPDHVGALCGMVRTLMVAGQLDRAEPFAIRAVQASGEPPQYELLIELFAQMGNDAKLAEATRALAKIHRDRGDEDKARELMQRLPADEVGARSRLAVDVSEVDEPELADEELLDDDPFVTVSDAKGGPALDLGDEELELEADDEIQLEVPKKGPPVPAAPPEADPDQLLAEASVYLRYGKRAQAIESLRAILDQDPNHRAALEKLGEAYVDDGKPGEAVTVWLRAAQQILQAGDAKALSVLRDRIAAIDPKAAARLVPSSPAAPATSVPAAKTAAPPPRAAAPAPEPEPMAELDLDLEVELDEAMEAAAASLSGRTEAQTAMRDEDGGLELAFDDAEIQLGTDEDASAQVPSGRATDATADDEPSGGLELSDDGSFEFEIDPGEVSHDGREDAEGFSASDLGEGLDAVLDGADAEPSGATSARPGTTTTTARIQEELEEAEFYLAQQMFDEAEAILLRVLELVPNHPSAMLRMGELQVARGAAPESVPSAPEARTRAGRRVAGTSEGDLGSTARFEDGIDLSSDGLDPVEDEVDPESSASGLELDVDVDVEIDAEVGAEAEAAAGIEIEVDEDDGLGLESAADALAAHGEEIEVERGDADERGADVTVQEEPDADAGLDGAALDESASGLAFDDDDEDTAGEADSAVASDESDSVLTMPSRPSAPSQPTVAPERPGTVVLPRPATPRPPMRDSAPVPENQAVAAAAAAPASADSGDAFDLREALADVFNDPGESARGRVAASGLSTVEDGFESIFSDFKKGVSATLGEGDYDTRYDLGIAYREMGLYEDAIGEFKICLESPARRFDSLYLMGLCARDLQRYTDAVHHLEQALALPDLPDDRTAGVYFDLAIAQSLAGDLERARANMRRVLELDPRFPNAAERLAELESSSAAPAASGERIAGAFESFDDLFADEATESEIPQAEVVESFESFDDVVSEVEATPVVEKPRPAATEAPPAPPAADPNSQSSRKPGRKKISFV